MRIRVNGEWRDCRQAMCVAELLEGLDNDGARWVKLEVLGDTKTLLPDPLSTLEALTVLKDEGLCVLCYTSDDPVAMAKAMRLAVEAGRLARRAGRIPRKLYATASSPVEGVIGAETD